MVGSIPQKPYATSLMTERSEAELGQSRVQGPFHNLTYRPDIDGLRTVAVVLVVLFHAFPFLVPGGFIGVDVFFCLSGFLITSILEKKFRSGRFSLLDFYVARIRRIFPALCLVLLATGCFGYFVLYRSEFAALAQQILASALFSANIYFFLQTGYFSDAALTKPLLHIWSLGVEEQYYLVWPLLMWAAHKLDRSVAKAALVVIAGSFLCNILTVDHHRAAAFFLPMARLWELGVGAWLATARLPAASHKLREWLSVFGLACIGAGAFLARGDDPYPGWLALFPVLGTGMLIWAGDRTVLARRLLSARAMVGVGLISYPLYLWHWPLLSFCQILAGAVPSIGVRVICIVCAFALAFLTYSIVERPIRRHARSWRLPAGFVLLMASTGMCALLATLLPQSPLLGQDDPATITFSDGWQEMVNSCGVAKEDQGRVGTCYQDRREPASDAVIGDSHAGQLMFGLFRNSAPGRRWVAIASAGCPPMLGTVSKEPPTVGYDGPAVCADTNRIAINRVKNDPGIKNVLLATAARIVVAPIFAKNAAEDIYPDAIIDGIVGAVSALHDAGKNVLFLVDSPDFPRPQRCAARPFHIPAAEEVSCTKTLAQHIQARAAYLRIVAAIKARAPYVDIIDPTHILCPGDVCADKIDGQALYTDGDHYSSFGNGIVGRYIIDHMH